MPHSENAARRIALRAHTEIDDPSQKVEVDTGVAGV